MALQHPFTSRQLHTHRNVRYFVLAILSVHNLYANENNKGKNSGVHLFSRFSELECSFQVGGVYCIAKTNHLR